MKGRYGALGGVLGSEDNARKVISALDRTNTLLASLGGVSLKLDRMLAKTDERVFGAAGVMDETQKTIAQLNAVLRDARESLKKADAVLADAQAIGAQRHARPPPTSPPCAPRWRRACARSRTWWTRSTANGRSRATRS